MPVNVLVGNDQIERSTLGLGPRIAEEHLGTVAPVPDDALVIDEDDSVDMRVYHHW